MPIEIKVLRHGDKDILSNVSPDVFDDPLDENLSTEFLADPRHHIVVAIDAGTVVGFASAVHYIHPDKSAELWINEVAVASTHRNRGIAKQIVTALLEIGRQLGCREAWVLTDRPNTAAIRLYESLGGEGTEQVMFTFRL